MSEHGAGRAGTAAGGTRDGYLDLVRLLTVGVVIIGHWLITVVRRSGGDVSVASLLETDLWAGWIMAVLPAVFFVVGGTVHTMSWRRAMAEGTGYATWLRRRAGRLLRPALPLVWLWAGLPPDLRNAGADADLVRVVSEVALAPLWFIAVYLGMVALLPALRCAHERIGWWLPALLMIGALGLDLLVGTGVIYRIHVASGVDLRALQTLGPLCVWGVPLVLGMRMADGLTRRHAALLVGLGTVVALLLWAVLGPPGGRLSVTAEFADVSGRTIHAALGLIVAGLIAAAGEGARQRAGGRAVTRLSAAVLPAYLWHGTALVAGVGLMAASDVRLPGELSAGWWALRPLWLIGLAALLVAIVTLIAWWDRWAAPGAVVERSPAPGVATLFGTAGSVLLAGLLLGRDTLSLWMPASAVLLTVAAAAAGALDGPVAGVRSRLQSAVANRRVSVALSVTFVVWLAGTGLSLFMAMASTLTFFGDLPTAEQQASGNQWMVTAAMVGLLVAALGAAGALLARRWKYVMVFAVAFAVTFAVFATEGGTRDALRTVRDRVHPPPEVEPGPPACAEFSGGEGDNECPGG